MAVITIPIFDQQALMDFGKMFHQAIPGEDGINLMTIL
jgi:hypothetical protein